jgi:CBS domain-containing protein
VTPNTDAAAALSKMVSSGRSRLMVGEDEHLAGIVSLKDLMGLPALKTDLDGGGFPRSAVTR